MGFVQATVQRKRDSLELMHSSRSTSKGEQDTSVAKLLREKLSIAASMKSINEVIRYSFENFARSQDIIMSFLLVKLLMRKIPLLLSDHLCPTQPVD